MSQSASHHDLSDRMLVELWTVTFGEPPPLVHDPMLMVELIEAELDARSRGRGD